MEFSIRKKGNYADSADAHKSPTSQGYFVGHQPHEKTHKDRASSCTPGSHSIAILDGAHSQRGTEVKLALSISLALLEPDTSSILPDPALFPTELKPARSDVLVALWMLANVVSECLGSVTSECLDGMADDRHLSCCDGEVSAHPGLQLPF